MSSTNLVSVPDLPKASNCQARYGPAGLIEANRLDASIPRHLANCLADTANHGIAKRTWSTYRTGQKMLQLCAKETGTDMTLPLSEPKTLTFAGWLIHRNVSSATIDSYLAAIRQQYIQEGLDPSNLRSPLLKQVLKGRNHQTLTAATKNESKPRLPITPTILKLLKIYLKKQPFSNQEKLLIWTILTIGFAGSFRIHELLCRNPSTYNPLDTLLNKDVSHKQIFLAGKPVEILEFRIKQEKTNTTPTPTVVDVYQAFNSICPIASYKKWKENSTLSEQDLPVFRRENGKPYTSRCLNLFLSHFTSTHFPNNPGKFTSHSLRAGLPSLLGQLGFDNSDIKATGRWSSNAYKLYTKLPRTRKAEMARRVHDLQL